MRDTRSDCGAQQLDLYRLPAAYLFVIRDAGNYPYEKGFDEA